MQIGIHVIQCLPNNARNAAEVSVTICGLVFQILYLLVYLFDSIRIGSFPKNSERNMAYLFYIKKVR
jgi:hypothetical protein